MEKFWESIYRPSYITGYNPFIIKNMNKAIERLVKAINLREKIVIYSGCDVDGLCGLASLLLVLKYLNADVEYYVSDEKNNSHILETETLKNHIHFLGAELLITVGCGIESKDQEILCNNLGIDLIVTENRKLKPNFRAIYINPSQDGCSYRYKSLSASGVTFKLMQAIAIYYNMKSINRYLDLILIGTISSEAEDKGENSVFIKEGVNFLNNTNNYGLRAIMEFYNIVEFNYDSIRKIIDVITPAIGAVDKKDNARIVVELLTTNDISRARQITKYLYNEKIR
ncbi:DHH family phosphoesterase [Clostridium fungisolvens]|uniref:Single-stranded-DNA-specific exonuclease RecJ n=1 Tax=Clostridium fungisolvens TaxID=1604897 RepID=A0A6V8SJX5_9CLOT|nr:DHH family phosphoesterase [Clostridium fungisolvens]GFP76845.1 Single-stranded-DNA-specific exonuclease RecJ [Clostridium fungisolvens]